MTFSVKFLFKSCSPRNIASFNYWLTKMTKNFSNCTCNGRIQWYPKTIIDSDSLASNFAVIVLNRQILIPPTIVKKIWQNANIRATVDGGTDKWLNFLQTYCQNENIENPNFITGDFDSVTKEALDYFKSSSCKQIHTPDQNETDFTKCLRVLEPEIQMRNITDIIVFQETSGRFDQIMANINTLFKANKFLLNCKVYLMSSNSLTWLLQPGKHSIEIPSVLAENKRWCSLIPIGEKCRVTTNGLLYDMQNHLVEFGGLVSSSNSYSKSVVEIESNGFLVWSMGIYNCVV